MSVDPGSAGFLEDFGAERFLDLIAGAAIFLPNLDEGRLLTGLDNPEQIATALGERFPVVALTLGIVGALYRDRWPDHLTRVISIAGIAMPSFWLAILLIQRLSTIGGGPQILEKNITLAVSKLLATALRKAGADVLMTRTTDTLIGLYDRGPIANKAHGDIFVSVHVNATGQRGQRGADDRGYETYFLAEAKTEDAKRVEQMENQAVRFETGGARAEKGDPLNFIINDMAQNEHLRESADLAESIEGGFRKFHPGPDRGVQQANFAVLRGAFMPAVLVEIGFGTNRSEAKYISDPDNEQKIADSIAKSILAYMDKYDARIGNGGSSAR